jgi:hypothetical protein
MKVFTAALSLVLVQSISASNSTNDDGSWNVTGTDDYESYAPSPSGTDYDVGTPAPTVVGADGTPAPYAEYYELIYGNDDATTDEYATPAPTAVSGDDYEAPTAVDDYTTSSPIATESDDYEAPADEYAAADDEESDDEVSPYEEADTWTVADDEVSTPSPSVAGDSSETLSPTAVDDYSEVTVEEIDDGYSMDYSSTVAAIKSDNSGAAVYGSVSLLLLGVASSAMLF